MNNIEKRRSPRLSTSIPAGLRFPNGPVKEGWGRIMNLSPEGLLLETRFPVKVAGVVYVTFILKDGAHFENLRARIIRTSYEDGYHIAGLAFDEVVDQETLRDVISSLAYEGGLTFE